MNIKQSIEHSIGSYCAKSGSTPHHPNLSTSNSDLKYTTIGDFFATEAPTVKKSIKISGKTTFKEKELLGFDIDTNGNRGYLTIFSIEDGEPFIMAQTKEPMSGVLNFQRDFSVQLPIECYKSCTNCQQEVSSVYIILSEQPLTKEKMKAKGLAIESDNSIGTRAFRHKTDESFEPIIAKVEFTII